MLIAMSRDLCDSREVVRSSPQYANSALSSRGKTKADRQRNPEIYAPLANRLGINWIKTELEDQCFKYLHGDEYRELAESIKRTRLEREQYIERVIDALRREMNGNGITGMSQVDQSICGQYVKRLKSLAAVSMPYSTFLHFASSLMKSLSAMKCWGLCIAAETGSRSVQGLHRAA